MVIGKTCFRCTVLCTFLFTLFFLTQSLYAAGSGSIKGSVLDNANGEALVGANIIIQNTSLGIAADIDGNFEIKFVPVGKWNVKVSCIGYEPIIREVEVLENKTSVQEFRLAAQAIKGEEVVVTAQARGQVQAINQQLASNKIANIVSEARIQELPDFNAAQAISRLPGVSTLKSSGEDDKVVIRGLAPQYNEVAIGGISLASTGGNTIGVTSTGSGAGTLKDDRSVDLTMVTPYMIKSIEVYKSITPDMEANVLGGYVNMELREAPPELHTNALFQSGYTDLTNEYGNYRAIVSASDRFFGDKLGLYVLANSEKYDRGADNLTATYATESSNVDPDGFRPVGVTGATLNRHVETRERYGANLILDYQLPFGTIKSVNMVSRLDANSSDYNTVLNYGDINNRPIDFNFSQADTKTDLAVNSLEFTNDFKFISIDVKAANTYSRNYRPLSPYYSFFQNGAISIAASPVKDTNITPENLTHFVTYHGDTSTLLGTTSLFDASYKENDQIYKADFKIPFNLNQSVSGYFKFGGEYRYNEIHNDQSTPYISIDKPSGTQATGINQDVINALANYWTLRYASTGQLMGSNFTSNDSKLVRSFLGNKFGNIYWAPNPAILNSIMNYVSTDPALLANSTAGGWFDGPYQNLPNDYKYIEKYYAGYMMAELDLGQQLMVVGGARYEDVNGLYNAYNLQDTRNPASQPFVFASAAPGNHFWLPMIQGKYNIAEWVDVRYSYTQTVARPDYTEFSPHFTISADSPHQINSGNPSLVPAQVYNNDLLFTFHSNELGLLSVGGFYKEIDHFTYATSYHLHSKAFYDAHGVTGLDSLNSFAPFGVADDDILNTFINSPYKAYVEGFEIDLQTRFWYLPAPLNGILLGINYTHVKSKATYPYFDEVPKGRSVVFIDSSRAGRLIDQPNDILNAWLGYDYRGFSARIFMCLPGKLCNLHWVLC